MQSQNRKNENNNEITIKWNNNKIEKLDIDECLEDNGGCDLNAKCTNIQGGFECTCQTGYSGDGFNCAEKSESNQQVGIGVGVTFGLLALIALIVLILFFLRKKVNFLLISSNKIKTKIKYKMIEIPKETRN